MMAQTVSALGFNFFHAVLAWPFDFFLGYKAQKASKSVERGTRVLLCVLSLDSGFLNYWLDMFFISGGCLKTSIIYQPYSLTLEFTI